MAFISRVSEFFISLILPPNASHHTSSAHTRSRGTRCKFSFPEIESSKNIRLRSTGHDCQSSGTLRSRNSRIIPSLLDVSRCSSCLAFAASSIAPDRYSGSPACHRTIASAHIWSRSLSRSFQTFFRCGCSPVSIGQNLRLPVVSCRKSGCLLCRRKHSCGAVLLHCDRMPPETCLPEGSKTA